MSKKPGMSAWADQAQKKLKEQKEKEMPGMLVAKQKATQDAKDGKAERAAQRKEALQLREAEEVRGVQESLQMLALDPHWASVEHRRRTPGEDHHLCKPDGRQA